jgi:LacI family transcriptional regulator
MAIGLLRAAGEHDIPVPGRFSIVGFDDIFGSDFTSPTLTTVRSPLSEAGSIAVNRALQLVEAEHSGNDADAGAHDLVTELIIRASTGPARAD